MKVSIIGTGRLGSCIAYSLMLKEIPREIVLFNRSMAKAEGHALDMMQGAAFVQGRSIVRAGTLDDTSGSDVLVYTAAAPWTASKTSSRDDELEANARILVNLIPDLARRSPNAILLMVSNPVDTLSYLAWRISGFPPSRVIGSGTIVDSARFRDLLSQSMGVHPEDIRAYVIGEHGPTQVPCISSAVVGGEKIGDVELALKLAEAAKASPFEIFEKKGLTEYSIAPAVSYIVETIARDSHRTVPVSILIDQEPGQRPVFASSPIVLGREGIIRRLHPEMNEDEARAFHRSLSAIRSSIDRVLDV